MPLNFGETKSMYVDRGSREVSKILSDRYLSNFMQTEAMRKEAAALEAAPFEGDQAMKAQILKDTDQFIQSTASKGDYENMTAEVVRAASNYATRSQPITKNNELYKAYNTKIDELVKDGKLPISNAENLKKVSRMQYPGLQMDEQGNVGGYFAGMEAAQDPNINKLLNDALSSIKTSSNSTVRRIVGAAKNGMIDVETEQGIEQVSPERIEAVMDPIFRQPDVRAFMEQTAELDLLVAPDDKVRGAFSNKAEKAMSDIEAMQSALAKETNDEKKAQIQQRIDNATEGLVAMKGDLENDNLASMRRTLAAERMMYEEMTMREGMQAKYGITKMIDKRKEFTNKIAEAKAGIPAQVGDVAIDYRGEAFQARSEFGDTFKTMRERVDSDVAFAGQYLEQIASGDLAESELASFQRQVQNHLASANRGIDIMIHEFGSMDMSEVDREQYNRLLQNVSTARSELTSAGNARGGQGTPVILATAINSLNVANTALQDFVEGKGYKRQQSTFTVSPIYTHNRIPGFDHTAPATDAEKSIYQSVMNFFEGSKDGEFEIYKPGTNERITLREWQQATEDEGVVAKSSKGQGEMMKDGVPKDFKVTSVGFGTIAPNGMTGSPTIEVKFDSDYGGGSFRVPVDDAFQVPGITEWANSNYIQFKGDIEQRVGNGMTSGSIPYTNRAGKKGEMVYRKSPTGETQVSFNTEGLESSGFMNINSKDFADFSNELDYSYDMSSTLSKFDRD